MPVGSACSVNNLQTHLVRETSTFREFSKCRNEIARCLVKRMESQNPNVVVRAVCEPARWGVWQRESSWLEV